MQDNDNRHLKLVSLVVVGIIVIALIVLGVLTLVLKNPPSTPNTPVVTPTKPVIRPSLVTTGFSSPTGIVASSDATDKRLFIIEQAGTIRAFSPDGPNESTLFLDIQTKVLSGGEMGLLGLAFHPDFAQNGYFFVNYIDKDQHTVVARYRSSSSNTVEVSSEKVLIKIKQPYTNHNGGDLTFGPDGYLYIALGDGGAAGDPENRAQDKKTFFGKILRIDINRGDPYDIPNGNPFANEPDLKREIWAYGLRNPWRISFDHGNGDLYIADVGQGKLEEINMQKSASSGGENYGWPCYEGGQSFKLAGCQDASAYVVPVLEYGHDEGRCSITGGYVYRGNKNPALVGKYFYGDYCSGQLFYGVQHDGKWIQTLAAKTPYAISTFGQGSDGELYFADFKTGTLYRLDDTAN